MVVFRINWNEILTLFRMGRPVRRPYQFFPCNFYKCRKLAPKTYWILVSTFLLHMYKISRAYIVPVPNYWAPQKKHGFFCSNPYKIEVVITSLIEMLVTKLLSDKHIYNIIWVTWSNFVGGIIYRDFDVITFIWKYSILRRTRVAVFSDVIKIATIFIKAAFKEQEIIY